jgi:hypothetical protein
MKKLISISISIVMVAFLFVSCNLFTPQVEDSFEIIVGGPVSKSNTSLFSDALVKSVKIRIFNDSDGSLITEEVLEKTDGVWKIRIPYPVVTGDVIIHAMAFTELNGEGEIRYQGTIENLDLTTIISSLTVPTALGYEIGNRGPGGGWVIEDKGSFTNNTVNEVSKMGKSWRYIEIAPEDLEQEWSDTSGRLDLDLVMVSKISGKKGKVYEKDKDEIADNLVLDTTSFYWGKSGSFSTTEPLEKGRLNTIQLDTMTSATPYIDAGNDKRKKAKGRKNPKDPSTYVLGDNLRRDTVEILKTKMPNGFTDWFIPSKEELGSIYDNKVDKGIYNLTKGPYWTSSEDIDETSKQTTDTDFSVNTLIQDDDYWAWSVDFSATLPASSRVLAERYRTKNVRPARAF